MRRIAIAFTVVFALGSVAGAAYTWIGGVGVWSDPNNWSGGLVGDVPGIGAASGTGLDVLINNGTVTLDCDPVVGILRLAAGTATDVGTLVMDTDHTLTVAKSSQQLVYLGRYGLGTINQSAGTMKVYRPDGSSTSPAAVQIGSDGGTGYYNLSGGILDTACLRKKAKTSLGDVNDTGGTIAISSPGGSGIGALYLLGDGDPNFTLTYNLGPTLLAPGGVKTVGMMSVGFLYGSTPTSQHLDASNGTLEFDIAGDASFDQMICLGDCDVQDATLKVNLLGEYVPDPNDTFDVSFIYPTNRPLNAGSGTFGSLPDDWNAAWVDTDDDEVADTLRLEYIPEPATLSLLGLGALSLIRRKR